MCDSMKWEKLLSDKRFHAPQSKKENGRTQFEKDIDRIIFSRAFRRLGRKTQVHLLSKDDHIHTRLAHSLEVASVGRSLGVMVGQYLSESKKNEIKGIKDLALRLGDIVQAACLAHDIGNPPFGHVTDEAIRKWFRDKIRYNQYGFNDLIKENAEHLDLEHFDGNAMVFRIVAYKEYYEDEGGMRLTYATLGAMLKYPWTSHYAEDNNEKFCCFKTQYKDLCMIAAKLGLIERERDIKQNKAEYALHPLAYLVEAADDICYRVLDIEDAIQLNILQEDYLKKNFLKYLKRIKKKQMELLKDNTVACSVKNGLLRGKMIGIMIDEIVGVFKRNYELIMKGDFKGDLLSGTKDDSLCKKLKKIYEDDKLKDKIYRNDRNLPLELGAYSVLKTLLDTSMEAAYEIHIGKTPSYKTDIVKKIVNRDGHTRMKEPQSYYKIIMLFLDYITGMTDDYATFVNKQLLGLGN